MATNITRYSKAVGKQINEAVKSEYGYWSRYNDERKDGTRRIKYMRNGYMFSQATYQQMEKKIRAKLTAAGIVPEVAKFIDCERFGYGPYKAFIVVVGA